jgi:hypothetical protein
MNVNRFVPTSYPARYKDRFGEEATAILNDGKLLTMVVRGVRFQGTDFDSREWPLETRLPQWKRLIETAKAELQSAQEEWKEFKKQWKPRGRTRRKPR